jgi:hypothetical protein
MIDILYALLQTIMLQDQSFLIPTVHFYRLEFYSIVGLACQPCSSIRLCLLLRQVIVLSPNLFILLILLTMVTSVLHGFLRFAKVKYCLLQVLIPSWFVLDSVGDYDKYHHSLRVLQNLECILC